MPSAPPRPGRPACAGRCRARLSRPSRGRGQAGRPASGSAPQGMSARLRLRRAQAGRRAPARAVHACHALRGARPGLPARQRLRPAQACWHAPAPATHACHAPRGRAQAGRHISGSAPPGHAGMPAASPRPGMSARQRLRPAQVCRHASGFAPPRHASGFAPPGHAGVRRHMPRSPARPSRGAPRHVGTPAAPPYPEQRHRVRHSRQPPLPQLHQRCGQAGPGATSTPTCPSRWALHYRPRLSGRCVRLAGVRWLPPRRGGAGGSDSAPSRSARGASSHRVISTASPGRDDRGGLRCGAEGMTPQEERCWWRLRSRCGAGGEALTSRRKPEAAPPPQSWRSRPRPDRP